MTIVVAAAGIFAARYWVTWDRFIGGHRDEALWLPVAMRLNDPSLFTTDPLVPALARFFPWGWVAINAAGLSLVPDPGTLLLLTSTLLLAVYAAGVCALSLVVSGYAPSAVVVGVTALRANVDLSGVGWGIFVGNAEPRAWVYAAAPWLFAALLAKRRGPAALVLLGACTGLLGNVHPVSASHVILLMTATTLLTAPSATTVVRGLALVSGFVLGVSPYAVQWLRAFEPGALPLDIFMFRNAQEFVPTWTDLGGRAAGVLLAPLAVASLALLRPPADAKRAAARTGLVTLGTVAAVGTLLAPVLTWLVPRLFALSPLRFSGYLLLVSLVLAGDLLRHLATAAPPRRLVAAMLALALMATAGGGRVGDLVGRRTLVGSGAATLWTDVGRDPLPRRVDDFLDLCRWARGHAAPSDLFLTPPGTWASFRVYAKRPLFVTLKDGGAVTMFSPAQAEAWYRRYRAGEALYAAAFEGGSVVAFARAHGIRYVVDDRRRPPIDAPIAYENAAYRIYAIAPRAARG